MGYVASAVWRRQGDSQDGVYFVVILPTFLSPTWHKLFSSCDSCIIWRPPRLLDLCNHIALGTPHKVGVVYPLCPHLDPSTRKGLCSHLGMLLGDEMPHLDPQTSGLYVATFISSPLCPPNGKGCVAMSIWSTRSNPKKRLRGHMSCRNFDFIRVLGTRDGTDYVAAFSTCGPARWRGLGRKMTDMLAPKVVDVVQPHLFLPHLPGRPLS